MLPQHFNADFYTDSSQYGYSEQFSQNPEQGPSASTSHSPPPQHSARKDSDPSPRKKQRSAPRPKRKRGSSIADDNPDNSPGSGSGDAQGPQRTVPKKKKANRACFHCQKAHLTCDDSRPCQRCIKRGLADKCTEGLRKKAKYLLNEEELAALKQQKSRDKSEPGNGPPGLPPPLPPPRQELDPPQNPSQLPDSDPLFNLAFDPTYPFGSEAANLEYSILSAILGNPSPPDDNRLRHSSTDTQSSSGNVNGPYSQFANPAWPDPPPQAPPQSSPTITPSFLQQRPLSQQPNAFSGSPPYPPHVSHAQSYNSVPPSFQTSPPSEHTDVNPTIHQPQAQVHYAQPTWTESGSGQPPMADVSGPSGHDTSYLRTTVPSQQQGLSYQTESQPQDPASTQSQNQGLAPLSPPPSNSSPGTPLACESNFPYQVPGQGPSAQLQQQRMEEQEQQQRIARARTSHLHQTAQWGISTGPATSTTTSAKSYTSAAAVPGFGGSKVQVDRSSSSVYQVVTKRYDYTQGYHDLMRHLHARFEKTDMLRVVRALAIVRPSLIALQMPLTEEDEVFVEKCFQRSLLELDKLISFGGTPTVVWRRTGEICLVGFEFTMLTGWTREELIGKSKYIYELFENQSTVEYYEKFAAHAFENTTQSVISHCVLLKPSGAPVPCTFCFSIRRDIFDLPNIIIGQWLPLL